MRSLLSILSFFVSGLLFSQTDSNAYFYTFGGLGNDLIEDMVEVEDGFVAVGMTASSGDGNSDIYLLKVDTNINYVWSKALGENNNDWGYAIERTNDNGFLIATTSNSFAEGYQGCLFKRDSVGDFVWKKCYGGNDWDFVYDLTTTSDGGFVFCGETYNNTVGFSDAWIVKINEQGDTLWTQTVGGALIEKGNSVIEASDSSIYVAGIQHTASDSVQSYVIKLSKDGELIWDLPYGGARYEYAYEIIENEPGKFTFTGNTNSNSSGDLNHAIINIDGNGVMQWFFTIVNPSSSGPDDDEMLAMELLPNGNLIFMGYSKTGGDGIKNITTFELTPTGGWAGNSTVIATSEDDEIYNVLFSSRDKIIGAGYSKSFGIGNQDGLILKLNDVVPTMDTVVVIKEDIAPIGIKEEATEAVNVYPTLVKNEVFVSSFEDIVSVEVLNVLGKIEVIQQTSFERITLNSLKPGVYFIRVNLENKKTSTTKIVKL